MKAVLLFIGLSIAFMIPLRAVSAQNNETTFVPATIIKMPKMKVPKKATKAGLDGAVRVHVQIDNKGDVAGIDEVTGPGPICRQVTRADVVAVRNAAKDAAKFAKFNPATFRGETQPYSMWLDFDIAARKRKATDSNKYRVKGDINFSAVSDPSTAGESKSLSGGVLNGKAQNLPKPTYPRAARAVRASGAVPVQVLIEENGDIFSAEAVGGHPLLRGESVLRACEAKFSPTLLEGKPVKVSGIITYNYVP